MPPLPAIHEGVAFTSIRDGPDFRQIVSEGYFYCDRTAAIVRLEQGRSQHFIRPRRFGKRLLLSMIENYYDVAREGAFGEIFGELAIGADPTPLRNRYFVLRLDFSCVAPIGRPEEVRRSLHDHSHVRIVNFFRYYRDNGFDLDGSCIHPANALVAMESLLGAYRSAGHPVLLLIDIQGSSSF